MNKCVCSKIQKSGEIWMQSLCNNCQSEIVACSWNCSLEICQNCKRDLLILEVLKSGETLEDNLENV
jgi:hypothetical protein